MSTVSRLIKRFNRDGMWAAIGRPHPGRPRSTSPEFVDLAARALRHAPWEFGLSEKCWTLSLLSNHLQRQTGLHLSNDHLSRVLAADGVIFGVVRSDPMAGCLRVANPDGLKGRSDAIWHTGRNLRRGLRIFVRILLHRLRAVMDGRPQVDPRRVVVRIEIGGKRSEYLSGPRRLVVSVSRNTLALLHRGAERTTRRERNRLGTLMADMITQLSDRPEAGAGTVAKPGRWR